MARSYQTAAYSVREIVQVRLDPETGAEIRELKAATCPDKAVLNNLADRADEGGRCFPGIRRIAADTGLSDRRVQAALRNLVASGLLRIEYRPNQASVFQLTIPVNGDHPVNNDHPVNAIHHPGEQCSPSPRTACTTPVNSVHPEYPLNIKGRSRERKARAPRASFDPLTIDLPDGFNSDACRAAWQRWCNYRAEARKRLTPSTAASQLELLAELGEHAGIESIENSIRGGWAGLFEPKRNGNAMAGRMVSNAKPGDIPNFDELDRGW